MAITLYSGPPGAGKSYALVEQVIVPAVQAGRRVLTNIEGVNPEAVRSYCLESALDARKVGEVVLFDGRRATEPGFFPTEEISDAETFVKGGDLIVFDEWRLYWPRRGKLPSAELEPFLRWHRHLVGPTGVACDVAIGTQLATDVHQDFRGLIERSYKFKKLKAVGLPKFFAWDAYEGHLQPKGGAYRTGNGKYRPEIFALYSSYGGGANATELNTDGRTSAVTKGTWAAVIAGVVVAGLAAWWVYRYFTSGAEVVAAAPAAVGSVAAGAPITPAPSRPSSSVRIVGFVQGDAGTRIIVAGEDGALRVLPPDGFRFDGGRPVSGTVDGKQVVAEDRVPNERAAPPIPALGLGR